MWHDDNGLLWDGACTHIRIVLCISESHYDLRREDSSSVLLNQLTKDLLLNSEQRNHLSVGLKHMCEERESQKRKKTTERPGRTLTTSTKESGSVNRPSQEPKNGQWNFPTFTPPMEWRRWWWGWWGRRNRVFPTSFSLLWKKITCTTITNNKFKNPGRVLCVCVPVPFQIQINKII